MKKIVFFLAILCVSQAYAVNDPCEIAYLTQSTHNLGEDRGVLWFYVFDTKWSDQMPFNDSLIHATCRLDIFEYGTGVSTFGGLNGSILYPEPYDNIEHGDRFTTTLGTVSFMYNLDEPFWRPKTTYAWQVHCYCLPGNASGLETQHICYWESDGNTTTFKTCTAHGNFSTGEMFYYENKYNGGVYVGLALLVIISLGMYVAIYYLISGLTFDWSYYTNTRSVGGNVDNVRMIMMLKIVGLFALIMLSLAVSGYLYYFADSISYQLARLSFVYFLLNFVSFFIMILYLVIKGFFIPLKVLGELVEATKEHKRNIR